MTSGVCPVPPLPNRMGVKTERLFRASFRPALLVNSYSLPSFSNLSPSVRLLSKSNVKAFDRFKRMLVSKSSISAVLTSPRPLPTAAAKGILVLIAIRALTNCDTVVQ
jgi:hypothetical protein